MDKKLADLERAYEEAKLRRSQLQDRLADLHIAGDPACYSVTYGAAFHALAEGDVALEEAARVLDDYRISQRR